ncbi:MAG: restriction endonuclease subunit S, partial [Aeriscardovia sp.]|nr:restriction endonuclease subunit S [Aeriscardovia sp.]
LPEVKPEEEPFEIPGSWKWVRLGEIVWQLTDGTHRTPKYSSSGVRFISVKDISSGILKFDNAKFITQSEHEELCKRCNPAKGDMLLSKVGTTGIPAIVDTNEQFSLFVSVALLKYNHYFINEEFLYYLLKSPLVQIQASQHTRGVGNKNWVLNNIAETLIPLPPLKEQDRIAKRIKHILPLCKQLGNEPK